MRFLKRFHEELCLLAVFLVLFNGLAPTVSNGQTPDRYEWKIERIQGGSSAWFTDGFVGSDIGLVWLDVPAQYFPLELWEVWVWWTPPPGQTAHHLAVRLLLYDGATGSLRYVLEHAVLLAGLNRIRLRVECSTCQALFGADDGPGIGVGIQYVTEFDNPVSPASGHLVFSNDGGCWSGFNQVFDSVTQQWVNPCAFGQVGNFAIRGQFEPLCRDRIGDIDGDKDIDMTDFAALQAAGSGAGGDVFGDSRVYSDFDNDYDVDSDDLTIYAGHMTGPENDVVCPRGGPGGGGGGGGHLQPFTPEAFPDIPVAVQTAPPMGDEGDGVVYRWTYTQVAVALVIVVVLVFIVGPCVNASCRLGRAANFASGGRTVDDLEEQRIRAAIDRIGQLGNNNVDAENCYFYFTLGGYYNPQATGLVRINDAPEDDVEFAATHVLGRITLHQTFVTGDRWDLWGVDGLALVLFAEWQHREQPGFTEHDCQEWLMQWRQAVGFENVAPEFGHGFGD